MEFRKVLTLRGPNIWARFPVLEVWVDIGSLNDTSSCEIPGFNDRLINWLPSLIEHRCSIGERGGFFERLRRGTYLAHILEHVTLELQSLAGTEVGFGRARQTSEDTVYRVAIEYEDETLGRACLEAARELCLAAVHDRPYDVAAEIKRLRELASQLAPSPAGAAILRAAAKRDIPARRADSGGLIRLGQGARQRQVDGLLTDRTSSIAASIARDKELTRTLLQAAGVPFPEKDVEGKLVAAWQLLVMGSQVVAVAHRSLTNGAAKDLLSRLNPEVAARAVDAALAIGLDVAGIDVAADDIGRPLEEQGGYVTAVVSNPDMALYSSQPVADLFIEHLFPEEQTGRIPIVGVTGVNGKTTTTRLIAHLVGQVLGPVGMACTEGVYVGDRRIITGDCSGPQSATSVLNHPEVHAAVLEAARGGILRAGLGFDRCDVAVLTNIGDGDHLGISDIHTPEQLARLKSTLVDAVAPNGVAVLNAADPLVVDTAKYCRGSVTYFARDGARPVIVKHRAEGGRAVFERDGQVILAEGDQETPLIPLSRVPLTHGGRVGFQVENVLAAVAAARAVGISCDAIRTGLETFAGNLEQVPGRFNLLEVGGATVIVDYGHNISSLRCLLEALEQFPHGHRSIVYSAAGDRRDSDMLEQGEMLGNAFDRVVLYEDTYLKGRKQGEIMSLLRQGMSAGNRVQDIHDIYGGLKAVKTALKLLHPGDLLVVQPDVIDDTVDYLRQLIAEEGAGREIDLDAALATGTPAVNGIVVNGTAANDLPRLEVREGRLGKSVHPEEPIRKGQLLLRTWGTRLSRRTRHSIQVDIDTHIIVPPPLLFLNHSCEPNCGLLIRCGVEEMELHALRHIEAGEELTLDYATFETEIHFMTGPCLCLSPSCRGRITGYEDMPQHVREAYGPYIAEYLRVAEPLVQGQV